MNILTEIIFSYNAISHFSNNMGSDHPKLGNVGCRSEPWITTKYPNNSTKKGTKGNISVLNHEDVTGPTPRACSLPLSNFSTYFPRISTSRLTLSPTFLLGNTIFCWV